MAIFTFDYTAALYRKNNHGQPCVWFAKPISDNNYEIFHGIVGKAISSTTIHTHRKAIEEVRSKFKSKRKEGYKYLYELKDNSTLPVEGELLSYLNTYLLNFRTNADGTDLCMLAKTFDNTNNKLFKKVSLYYGQWKINGLRCNIHAYREEGMFGGTRLKFVSREGVVWNSLSTLEHYLLNVIPDYFINRMIEEHYILDGEVYLPGYDVNDINHFVKDPNCVQNKQLQFWCYDLAIPDYTANERKNILLNNFLSRKACFLNKEEHLSNKEKFLILPSFAITDEYHAITARDSFIECGFEGLILRNPNDEYQFGKRNSSMIKFKKSTDGKFQIIDIKPEGIKRPDIPLFICKNDINDAQFECHLSAPIEIQKLYLKELKDKTIGKYMHIEYGERSGIKNVPFHLKQVKIL